MDNVQRDNLIKTLDRIENEIISKDVYVGFNGHGHLRYIQATKAGLLKLGIFFIKSSFYDAKYIDIDSDEKTLDWIDPESEESIDYIEIISDIDKTIRLRRIRRRRSEDKKSWYLYLYFFIKCLMIICLMILIFIGFATVIHWISE